VELKAGDWITIPAHRRHRVEATSTDALWLAVHCAPAA
jgi:cupin 2 domain-containing protein